MNDVEHRHSLSAEVLHAEQGCGAWPYVGEGEEKGTKFPISLLPLPDTHSWWEFVEARSPLLAAVAAKNGDLAHGTLRPRKDTPSS